MKANRDQVTGAFLVLLGVYVFFSISGYKVPFTMSYPGPRALPGLAAFGFVVCGAGIFLEGCRNAGQGKFLTPDGWMRLGLSMLILILYVAGMSLIGYWIPTLACLFVISTYYARGYKTTVVQRIIFSAAFAVVIYLIYQIAFGYHLPTGSLFG